MADKIYTDVNKLLLVLTMKKKFLIYFVKIEIFWNLETKSSLSKSVFIFSNIPEILETKFYVHRTQRCRNLKSIILYTRCVRKVSDLRSYLNVGAVLRNPYHGIFRSSPHLIEPHSPSGASIS